MLVVKECPMTSSSKDEDQWIQAECLCAAAGETPSLK